MITKHEKKAAAWILTMMLGVSTVFSQGMAAYASNGLAPEIVPVQEGQNEIQSPTNLPANVTEVVYGSNHNSSNSRTELYIMSYVTRHVYTIGSGDGVTIQCSGELKDFRSVQVDGVLVDAGNYILEEGSTILTFVSKYLDTLSVGTHKVTLGYTYGSVDTELTILGPAAVPVTDDDITKTTNGTSDIQRNVSNTGSPVAVKTGDDTQTMFWPLALAAALGICVALGSRKRMA